MKISTSNFKEEEVRDSIINNIILNQIEGQAKLKDNIKSNNIAKFYGISCEKNDDIITIYIIMEHFDYNL